MKVKIESLSDEASRVVDALLESASDGYTVMSMTGLTPEELTEAVKLLNDSGICDVKGDISIERIGEAYLYLSTYAQELAATLRSLRSS